MAAGGPDIGALLASLGGGGGPGGPPPGMGGPPPPDPGGGGSPEDKPVDILKQMIELAQNYMQAEPDEEDKATMAKVLANLQQYLAKDQQERDQAMAGQMNPRVLRKTA